MITIFYTRNQQPDTRNQKKNGEREKKVKAWDAEYQKAVDSRLADY